MPSVGRLNLEDLPDSAYARELRTGVPRLRFEPDLERQYVVEHLQGVRRRVQLWFTLSVALSALFTTVQLFTAAPGAHNGVGSLSFLNHIGTIPCALVLAWLSWSRYYERLYLPVARVLAPIYAIQVAISMSLGMAAGREYAIASLAVHLIAAFFFMGLMFRASLITALAMLGAYALSTLVFGSKDPMWQDLLVMALTAVLSAIVEFDVERSYRRTFLKGALLAQWVTRDGLSGLMNRRTLDAEMPRVWEQAQRDRRSLALMMIDIDHFKAYNDTYGHQFGDEAIRMVARLLGDATRRPLDLAARYGGEEFVVLLYDVSLQHAQELAERVRQAVAAPTLPTYAGQAGGANVTVSIGLAAVTPTLGRTPQGALQLADEALYEAKQQGRNRVVTKGPEEYRVLRTGRFAKAIS